MIKHSSITLFVDPFGQPVVLPIVEYSSGKVGPHLLCTASIHGDEPISTAAALQLVEAAERDQYKGRITVFSCLNSGGLLAVNRGYTFESQSFSASAPNLNRMFGKQDTSLTSYVAQEILDAIIKRKPDIVLDLHSYSKDSLVHVIVDRPGGNTEKIITDLTRKSQVPFYLEYEAASLEEQALDHSLSMQLCLRNIPAVTVELGPRRGFSKNELDRAVVAIKNLATAIEICSGEMVSMYTLQPSALSPERLYQRFPLWVEGVGTGIFSPCCNVGESLSRNAIVGKLHDVFGRMVSQVLMPEDGVIIQLTDDAYSYPHKQVGVAVRAL